MLVSLPLVVAPPPPPVVAVVVVALPVVTLLLVLLADDMLLAELVVPLVVDAAEVMLTLAVWVVAELLPVVVVEPDVPVTVTVAPVVLVSWV